MPILDIQKRARELGRIRLGQKGDKGQPQKLDRFRFTGHSHTLITKIAELYGGTVNEWTPAGGTSQWEVISDTTRVPIMVPPQPVSQWYEFWTRAGCQHRCDGRTNVLTDELCSPEDPKHLEALKKPTTRLNVVLRDVEGIGVWRVETHGWNAAIELPDVAEFLAAAGGYVNGYLSLEQRTSIEQTDQGPKTRHYLVPIIEVDVTPAQLMAGHGRIQPVELGAGGPVPSQAPALEAPAQQQATPPAATEVKVPTPEQIAGFDLDTARRALDYLDRHSPNHPARDAVYDRVADLEPSDDIPAPQPEVDEDGAVDAEVVEEQPALPVNGPGAEPDPDVVWNQILKSASDLRGWGLTELNADFKTAMGLIPDEASGAELAAYLHTLTTGEEPAA